MHIECEGSEQQGSHNYLLKIT